MVSDRRPPLVADACVHPAFASRDELRSYLDDAYRLRGIPGPERYYYGKPGGEFSEGSYPSTGAPGSDRELLERHVFGESGADVAVLLPLTRGMSPDRRLGSAICSATNRWLAEKWLDGAGGGRYRGSIRINPNDVEGAIEEIGRWRDHPGMVQVAVPLESHSPYGQPQYWPIWKAAASVGLPIAVHSDAGAGVEFAPTGTGYPRFHVEYAMLSPLNYFYHLASLICEGVFDQWPNLKFVFTDGGSDLLAPLMWRLDSGWRQTRSQSPLNSRQPSTYISTNVRFCTSRFEGPSDQAQQSKWTVLTGSSEILLYGSHYPHWSFARPDSVAIPAGPLRARVLGENASDIYRLQVEPRELTGKPI